MTTHSIESCATEPELVRLVDGELSVNDTARWRAHAATCVQCARSLAALEELTGDIVAHGKGVDAIDDAAMVAALMRRIDRESTIPVADAPRPKRAIALAVASVLVAAAAAVAVVPRAGNTEGTFVARGQGAPLSLRQAVSVTFTTRTIPPRDLQNGSILADSELLGATYNNVRTDSPAFLLAFAIDSATTVHWLYPAYETPGTDPSSLALFARGRPTTMPSSVRLDAPAEGAMRLVSLISEAPHHVSEIESLPPSALTLSALRTRFPDAVIDETVVTRSPATASPSSH